MRIGIAGLSGTMGQLVALEVQQSSADLVGGLTRASTIPQSGTNAILPYHDMASLAQDADVIIDFTAAATVQTYAEAMVKSSTAWVLGSSGLTDTEEDLVSAASRHIPIVYAANFSPAVTLMAELTERMAAALSPQDYDAEIIEMHHRRKKDVPSGTALALGRAVAQGRQQVFSEVIDQRQWGLSGPRVNGNIGFSAMRGGQVVGDHTVLFAADSEHLSITHHAIDRRIFAIGALKAAFWLYQQQPGLYSMRDVLGLTK